MDILKSINKSRKRKEFKDKLDKVFLQILKYTILSPLWLYYVLKDKYGVSINKKRYKYVIDNREKYHNKVLNEILKYIVKKDLPILMKRKDFNEYIIYKDYQNDDINGDLHLKEFISLWTVSDHRKKHNKISKLYYNANQYFKRGINYDLFIDEIESYFGQSDDIVVTRGSHDCWGNEYEYILLKVR